MIKNSNIKTIKLTITHNNTFFFKKKNTNNCNKYFITRQLNLGASQGLNKIINRYGFCTKPANRRNVVYL